MVFMGRRSTNNFPKIDKMLINASHPSPIQKKEIGKELKLLVSITKALLCLCGPLTVFFKCVEGSI